MADLKKIQVDGQLYDINVPDGKIGTDQLKDGRVALAENLVGRGSVPAEYTFRTAGGSADIGSGSALIKMLKGRTLVFNQLVGADTASVTIPSGHKYISYITADDVRTETIATSDGSAIAVTGGVDCVFDLTLMTLASSISTVAEFKALFPLDYYAYNAGQLISVTATGIKTNGFNQMVEQPLNMRTQGTFPAFDTSKYTRVFGGKEYYYHHADLGVGNWRHLYKVYDLAGNEITDEAFTYNSGGVYYNPSGYWLDGANNASTEVTLIFAKDCYVYFAFCEGGVTSETPVPLSCLNLSWSGYRNGEYESYWSETRQLPITTLTGKKDGEGESVVIFGDGLNSFGNTYDEITAGAAVKRLGLRAYAEGDESDPTVLTDGTNTIYVLDTPETYVLDEPLTLTYKVDDFGTEKELPQNDDEPVTAPIRYEVQYAMNAVDTLRRLPVNYISKESMEAFLAELDSTLGAALSATVETTMTWDADNEKYTFSMTVTPNAEPEP